ncbi:MAG: DTW domain-containing protein [Myxococcales bacterium]|nr:DTW domain-containing protein [Myxococcales bacterium]MCB9533002.1 DTW domain-containing protein [Myxococcales bacterium]
MTRANYASLRCQRCRVHLANCVCHLATQVSTATRVVVVMHRREVDKPTNTGRIALMCLPNSELRVRGEESQPLDLSDLVTPDRRLWLLFPSPSAITVDEAVAGADSDDRPITLVVPDGTWGQARRFVNRTPALERARHVVPAPGPPTRYRLRREHVDSGLATAEAIARTLRVIDGPEPADVIETVFDATVAHMLRARGATVD